MAVRRAGLGLLDAERELDAHAEGEDRLARVVARAWVVAERFPAGEQFGVLELEVLHRHGGFGGHGASFSDGPPPGQASRGLLAVRRPFRPSVPPGIAVAPGYGLVYAI